MQNSCRFRVLGEEQPRTMQEQCQVPVTTLVLPRTNLVSQVPVTALVLPHTNFVSQVPVTALVLLCTNFVIPRKHSEGPELTREMHKEIPQCLHWKRLHFSFWGLTAQLVLEASSGQGS